MSYICETCDKSFAANQNLKTHINTVHMKLKPFKCDYCDSSFGRKSNIQNHIKVVHMDYKPFGCNHCEKFFAHNCDLKRHIVTHETVKVPRLGASGVKGLSYLKFDKNGDTYGKWVVRWTDTDKKVRSKTFIHMDSWGKFYTKERSKELALEYQKEMELNIKLKTLNLQ